MNNRGEMNVTGLIIVVAITLVVGLILFQAIAQEVGKSTNTVAWENKSLASASTNGLTQYLTDCRALSDVVVFNATNDVEIPADNFTVVNNVLDTNGALAVNFTSHGVPTGAGTAYNRGLWQVSGTCQPTNYIADSGGRAMANLIVVMFALAVLVVALTPTLRNGLLEAFGQ